MKAYRAVDIWIYIFLTSTLAGGELSASHLGRFTPRERAPGTNWIGSWVDPRADLNDLEKRKFLTLPGLELRPLHLCSYDYILNAVYVLFYPHQSWKEIGKKIFNIVTCQPIVLLRNRTLLGSRPLSASRPNTRCAAVGEAVSSPCRAVPNRTAPCVATQKAAMTSHGITLVSEATPCKHSDLTQHSSHLAHCRSDACTIEGL
jgi:hypothetical protein